MFDYERWQDYMPAQERGANGDGILPGRARQGLMTGTGLQMDALRMPAPRTLGTAFPWPCMSKKMVYFRINEG